ncbi:MAG: hypothetical protein HY974_03545 [Candidatus Kerfeldbacteria bacterium]|nr:hypothetical protein [Candidatus Kerfeldbacteria bacterium]
MFSSAHSATTDNQAQPAKPQSWGEIYTMPTGFQAAAPEASGSRKWWLWLLLVVLLAAGGAGIYLTFLKPEPGAVTPPPANVPSTPPVNEPPPREPELPPQSLPRELDRTRFLDVKNIQAALELYQADNKKYPLAPLPIALGLEPTKLLSGAGFGAQTQGTIYLEPVPKNPTPGGQDYLYESLDGSTYTLGFRLDEGTAGLAPGDHQATPQGVDGVSAPQLPPPGPVSERQITPPTASLDTDQDGLTDAEEPLFGTEVNKPDTDGDGFLDGAEVKASYDPSLGDGAQLATSPHLATYTSTKFGYVARYPQAWLAKAVDEGESEVLFSGTEGEFVEVLVVDNPDSLSAPAWYAKQVPGLKAAEVPTLTSGSLIWAWSLDGLNAYLATDKYLITLSYNIGTRTEASFYQLFRLMVKMFKPGAGTTIVPVVGGDNLGSGNVNNNSNTNLNNNSNVNANLPVNEPG